MLSTFCWPEEGSESFAWMDLRSGLQSVIRNIDENYSFVVVVDMESIFKHSFILCAKILLFYACLLLMNPN